MKAYLRRAKINMDLEQFEDAVRDYEKINKMDKNRGMVVVSPLLFELYFHFSTTKFLFQITKDCCTKPNWH